MLLISTAFAQESTDEKLSKLLDEKQYDKVIKEYADNTEKLSAKSLYYVGFAYYMKEDDVNSLRFFDLSISKDPKDSKPYFYKGVTFNIIERYDEAIKNFKIAIELKNDDADYYVGLGIAHYSLKNYDLAIDALKKSTEQKEPNYATFNMIAEIYKAQENEEKALNAYYVAQTKIPKNVQAYQNTLFNIGLLEYLKGNYEKSEKAYKEFIELNPTDYVIYSKLIQIYYASKNYEKAQPYKKKLYEAHQKGELNKDMKDMFCFDQFKWKSKRVMVYERFEEGSKSLYYKHIFYIINEKGNMEYSVQTEFSPILAEQGKAKYLIGKTTENEHFTYGIPFDDNPKYEKVKQAVLDVLDGKEKPISSSSIRR
jgi:tetratricopeptide (TPR) repeat protein